MQFYWKQKNIQSYQKQTQVTNKLTTSNPKVILTKIDKHFNHLVVIMLMNRVFFNRLDVQVRNRLTKEQSLVINIIEDFYLYHFKINNILKNTDSFIEFINKNYSKYTNVINQLAKMVQIIKYNPKFDNIVAFELAKNNFIYEWLNNQIKRLKLINLNLNMNNNQEQIINNEKLIKQYNDEKILLDNLINASLFHKNQ
ncbi:hypothetical protein [Ureaplasma urealyticum]|uniref:DNA primase n=1 Tax=Ureaplasma urealyticum TaxID=2130 RepID=A0ABD4SLV5_UREUR|nr:hypothetical protein [Ureaplasma urealyticum]MCF1349163.1 DNA primase [Ureaplasma urealyticum]